MENDAIAVTVFWTALSVLFYTYVGYPVVLWVRRCSLHRPVRKDMAYAPSLSFLILAHNEEEHIRRKLENTLNLEYPGERPEILVASDGSTDRTNEIVLEFKDRHVSLLTFRTRRGKAQALNDAIPMCRGEIVIVSDTRQIYSPWAILELVANFGDPEVGAVTGDLQFLDVPGSKVGAHMGQYWRYEKWIRRLQSETDSTPVVTGAIYAIRRSLFQPLPGRCIADDLAIPMNIIMQGFRVIFDPEARAYDHFPRTLNEEFRKRTRTIAGSYQFLAQVPSVLNPGANRTWFDFVSHKVFRVLAPFALLAVFAANLAIPAWPYQVTMALQMVFYGMAGVGAILAGRGAMPRALSAPYTFVMLNAAAGVALFKLLTGAQTHLWEKSQGTDRVMAHFQDHQT